MVLFSFPTPMYLGHVPAVPGRGAQTCPRHGPCSQPQWGRKGTWATLQETARTHGVARQSQRALSAAGHGHGDHSWQGRTAGEAVGPAGAGGAQGGGGAPPGGMASAKAGRWEPGAHAGTECLQGGEGTGACARGVGEVSRWLMRGPASQPESSDFLLEIMGSKGKFLA